MAVRQTDWVDTRIGLTIANNAQDTARVDGGSTQVVLRGTTIIRTIVSLYIVSTTVAGAWGIQELDLAIGISEREAFNAGVFPDPNVGTDKPARGWIYRTALGVSQETGGGGVVFPVRADIRGARKIESGIVYLIVTNGQLLGTSFTVQVRGIVRMLMKLP